MHSHPPRRHQRVQHDLGAEFDAFGTEVALDELMGGSMLADEQVGLGVGGGADSGSGCGRGRG